MKSRIFVVGLIGLLAVAAGVVAFGQRAPQASAFAEIKVDNMTCGACAGRVERAVRALAGISQVEVDVPAGIARVAFNTEQVDGARIAAAVNAAGYPAQLVSVADAQQWQAAQQAQRELAERYVGQIGERLVSRDEFEGHVALMANGVPGGLRTPALAQHAWRELVQRELLLVDAAANGIHLQDGEVLLELERMRGAMAGFDERVVARFGSVDAYFARLKGDLTISRHLEQNLAAGVSDPQRRQMLVQMRLQEAAARTPVKVFDLALQMRGGGCC